MALRFPLPNDVIHVRGGESLRRVATIAARGGTPEELVAAVASAFDGAAVTLGRYEDGRAIVVLASANDPDVSAGSYRPFHRPSVPAHVLESASPVRIGATAGAPIVVAGAVWGVLMVAAPRGEPLPAGAEDRLDELGELVGVAIANAESRERLERLADEQAALRRVATLVAEGTTAAELFSSVAREVADLFRVSAALLDRYEPDRTAIMLAAAYDPGWTAAERVLRVGMRWPADPGSLTAAVHDTGRAARIDDYSQLPGAVGELWRSVGIGSGCGAPIVVDGKLWGAIRVFSREGVLLPPDTESGLERFTRLVATAVLNTSVRADLIASRARIVEAGDDARRRIERNLHDGTQQRLIAVSFDLQRIRAALREDQPDLEAEVARVQEDLASVLADVRELSRGLHPPMLSHSGLKPALRALVHRSAIPVELHVDLAQRPAASLETAVYYVVSEALTNAIRHAHASKLAVTVVTDHAGGPFGVALDGRGTAVNIHATIADDGVGGANPSLGSGLTGLLDRVDALGGRLVLDSPPGGGTRIAIELPFEAAPAA